MISNRSGLVLRLSTPPHLFGRRAFAALLAIGWLMASPVTAPGQTPNQVSATVSVSKSKLQIADPLQVTVRVRAPLGTKVILPEINSRWGEFDVLDQRDLFDIPDAQNANLRT